MPKTKFPATLIIAEIAGLALGGWMIIDGLRNVFTGDYARMDGQLGPWAQLVSSAGIDPMSLGPGFVAFGLIWLISLAGLLWKKLWAWRLGVVLSLASVLYLGIGTILALVVFICLILKPTRAILIK